MRISVTALAAASFMVAAPGFAQTTNDSSTLYSKNASTSRTTTAPAPVSNPNDTAKTLAAPVAGKNSFTQAQVVKRLQEQGYGNVSGLTKDSQSIWHASATMSGKPVEVAIDYQGNITAH